VIWSIFSYKLNFALGFCQCWLNDRRIIWCVNYTTLEISRFCWSANQVDFENGYYNGCMYFHFLGICF